MAESRRKSPQCQRIPGGEEKNALTRGIDVVLDLSLVHSRGGLK